MAETIFHKIMRKEIPATIVHEDEQVVAFRDNSPVANTHILIVPRKTVPSVAEATAADATLLGHMVLVAAELARKQGISESGYRLVFNCGGDGGQSVPQLHLHLLGGRSFSWPPG
jgi:histidine triad (HIT) family protein